jgi:hypothetical protein
MSDQMISLKKEVISQPNPKSFSQASVRNKSQSFQPTTILSCA